MRAVILKMSKELHIVILPILFALWLGRGNTAQISNSQLGEASKQVHIVHLRTGIVNVDALQDSLPPPTAIARRLLLQQQQPSTVGHPPSHSPEWGPLARAQLWLLTLGPDLHYHEGFSSTGSSLPHLIGGHSMPPADVASATVAAAAPLAEQQKFGEAQSQLVRALHRARCALVSFLPPAAWLLAVAEEADLAPILQTFPGVRLAPYGPASMRVSPELSAALELLQQAGEAVAERLVAGERLDKLLADAKKEQSGWLLGAMRAHLPTRGSSPAPAESEAGGRGTRRETGLSGGGGGDVAGAPCGRVQIEVHFPHLEVEDLEVLMRAADESQSQGGNAAGSNDAGGEGGSVPLYHPASAATADWSVALSALSPLDCPPLLEPDFGSPELLLVGVCPRALEATVEWLAAAPQVSWLAPRLTSRLHNLVAGAIVQSGGSLNAAKNASAMSSHPFWAAGISGANQVAGCGDSGLDFGHCYFYDASIDVSASTQIDSSGTQLFNSTQHRKLRSYLALVQDMVDSFGHGTHVAGTLIGSRYDKVGQSDEFLAPGTGQAPSAKVAFMDLSRGNSDGVWTPGDLFRSYFNLTYRLGARVHSDSWGSELTAYDGMSASLDRFTFTYQDFVSVYAAGNYGDKSTGSSRGTVTSPAVAKNCIAVGATMSLGSTSSRPWVPMSNMMAIVDLAGGQRFTRSVRVVKASFGNDLDSIGSGGIQMVVANPENACGALANAGAVAGKAVLVQRGGCRFTDKARYVAAVGARAIIVYNDVKDSGYFSMTSPPEYVPGSITLGGGSVPLSTGLWLKNAVAAGTVTLYFSKLSQSDYPPFEDVAAYSSVGPTTDGRIKPDIVAPGTLLSAYSSRVLPVFRKSPSCDSATTLTTMSGTSMATPVVAGSALLVRQYFMDGFYPDGVRNVANSFIPTGPLIKAVLLGGADHLTGVVADTGMPLEDAPSYRQGFGRLSLLHSLPLASNTAVPGWRLQVVDGASLASGQQHQFCVMATGGPLRITLAWYDYPGDQAAARALVNNLDLQVRAAGRGLMLDLGNGAQDTVNTVEQVWYDDLPTGDVAITVSAVSVFQKAFQQPYALVVQGKFSGSLRAPTDSDSGSTNTCAAQLAVILDDISSPPITNSKNVTFYFSTQDGSAPQAGFQCRLLLDNGTATNSTPSRSTDWGSCTMPSKTYFGLVDGRYTFQVRVQNEQLPASRAFLVDTAPPVISLASSLPGLTDVITASDNATFDFSATDVTSAVAFTCRLDFTGGAQGRTTPPFLRFGPRTAATVGNGSTPGRAASVRQTVSCSSPVELIGMSYGDYSLLVSAVDAAGNRADVDLVSWRIRYSSSSKYGRIVSGPSNLVASRNLSFRVVGFLGSAAEVTPPELLGLQGGPAGYEVAYVQQPLSATGTGILMAASPATVSTTTNVTGRETGNWTLQGVAANASWAPMTSESVTVTVPSDGPFVVLMRPRSSSDPLTWGWAAVLADTTAPTVVINLAPKAYQSDPRVTIRFAGNGTDDDTRFFLCRFQNSTSDWPLGDANATVAPYSFCRDSATFNVSEGYWLFQVKGRDAAGNVGIPANASFITDLEPPVITTDLSTVVNVSRLEWTYSLEDTGTGVANSSCSFAWTKLDSGSVTSDGDEQYPPATQKPKWMSPCPTPPIRYTVQDGVYIWSLTASDRAGLRSSLDLQVLVDLTPPSSKADLRAAKMLPSKFTLYVTSRDWPATINSGMMQQYCRISTASAPPPSSPPPLLSSPPPPAFTQTPPDSKFATTSSDPFSTTTTTTSTVTPASGGSGFRRIAQQQQSPPGGGGPRLSTGIAITLEEWHVCDPTGQATNISYYGFSTGFYSFSVRGLDNAGNLGEPSSPLFFEVDASLSDESVQVGGEATGTPNRTRRIIIGVAILVAGIVLIVSAVAIFIARRRHLRKRSTAAARQALPMPGPMHGIALQNITTPTPPPPAPGTPLANGNGYVNGSHVPPAVMVVTPPPAGSYYQQPHPYSPVMGGLVAGIPADPALAAALAASAAGESRARVATAEEERVRLAIAISLEEDNLRRAKQASLAAALHHTTEQDAIDAAITASLREQEHQLQLQQHRASTGYGSSMTEPSPQPSAPAARPLDFSLI